MHLLDWSDAPRRHLIGGKNRGRGRRIARIQTGGVIVLLDAKAESIPIESRTGM
jgi:hypothetical protein